MRQAAVFRFKPFSKKQKKLLTWWLPESPYHDYDMVIADGSIRSGKTIAAIDGFVMWSLATFEHEAFILAGKSMGALKRNVLRPMFKILAAKGIHYRYNRSENYIEIGTNTYYCFGANNEASQDVLQGLTAAGALADEVALFPESFVEQMIARCSVDGAKIWMNCNPESPYHFIKTEYIDKAKEKRILHLHFTLDDNLTLSQKVKDRYKRLFAGLWYKRMILGLWVMAEGVIYDMFNPDKHIVDVLPGGLDHWMVGVDYGTSNPCVFVLIGRAGKRYYQVREYYWDSRERGKQKTDGEYAEDFIKFLGDIRPEAIYVDPSAASFIAELRKRRVNNVVPANNDVLPGIHTVSRLLANDELFIHRGCIHSLREFGAYVWDPKAQKRGEDAPLKENDHAHDARRYALHTSIGVYQPLETGSLALDGWS